ncbi:MAG: endonuclease Q family protein [Patescibacteria group bacterium]
MIYIADFHIHSKYSRATSKQMDLEHLNQWAKIKGLQILGSGDFTHPLWFKELKEKLRQKDEGIYQLNFQFSNSKQETNFICTTEISCIYTKNDKIRRIHLLIFAPNLETVEKINQKLGEKYNLKSDGRPIFGLDAKELTKILLEISPEIFIVPAHIWTPWYSLFGSKSGFNSVEECFEELTSYIYTLETGLSSDPAMNWRWSYLDQYTLISNSDAHSLENLGREANVFDFPKEPNYFDLIRAIKTRQKFLYTIEFFPEEGKYHFDGHRLCGIRLTPEQTKKERGICPKCRRPLTVGVMYRVEELADRDKPQQPKDAPAYKSIIPLKEILAEVLETGPQSKAVTIIYNDLIKKGESEFNILLNLSEEELKKIAQPKLVEAILRMRYGQVIKEPGYDGVYGRIKIFPMTKDYKSKYEPSIRTSSAGEKTNRQGVLF